jgi:hypothetical protein
VSSSLGSRNPKECLTQKIKALWSCKTSVAICQSSWHNVLRGLESFFCRSVSWLFNSAAPFASVVYNWIIGDSDYEQWVVEAVDDIFTRHCPVVSQEGLDENKSLEWDRVRDVDKIYCAAGLKLMCLFFVLQTNRHLLRMRANCMFWMGCWKGWRSRVTECSSTLRWHAWLTCWRWVLAERVYSGIARRVGAQGE